MIIIEILLAIFLFGGILVVGVMLKEAITGLKEYLK